MAPCKWAAMAEMTPGRVMVHGGLSENRVFAQAAVLEITSLASTSHPGEAAADTEAPLIQLDDDGADPLQC
jgi:hypothetical protein